MSSGGTAIAIDNANERSRRDTEDAEAEMRHDQESRNVEARNEVIDEAIAVIEASGPQWAKDLLKDRRRTRGGKHGITSDRFYRLWEEDESGECNMGFRGRGSSKIFISGKELDHLRDEKEIDARTPQPEDIGVIGGGGGDSGGRYPRYAFQRLLQTILHELKHDDLGYIPEHPWVRVLPFGVGVEVGFGHDGFDRVREGEARSTMSVHEASNSDVPWQARGR